VVTENVLAAPAGRWPAADTNSTCPWRTPSVRYKDDIANRPSAINFCIFLQDYVTEKLFEALNHNLLPVVLGKK